MTRLEEVEVDGNSQLKNEWSLVNNDNAKERNVECEGVYHAHLIHIRTYIRLEKGMNRLSKESS